MVRKLLWLLLIPGITIAGMTLAGGCKKASSPSGPTGPPGPTGPTAPTIAAIAPDSGAFNTSVTITGTNFSTTSSSDAVTINGVAATVSSATATQLVITVPKSSGTGPIKLTIGTNTVTGPTFTYLFTYTVSTLAGSTLGDQDGTGTAAEFRTPYGIAVDTAGNVIVADDGNNKIKMVTPAGVVTTIAGTGAPGFKNGAASTAEFLDPSSVAVDPLNNILVADVFNYKIREISTAGNVSTVAGTTIGQTDGPVATAQFDDPGFLTVDAAGSIYVCDSYFVRLISGGNVSTLYNGQFNSSTATGFIGISVTKGDTLFLTDFDGTNVYTLTNAGVFASIAGSGIPGFQDGTGTSAYFSSTKGLCVDANGNAVVADQVNQKIRLVTPAGITTTIAGTGTAGDVDGAVSTAQFNYPEAVAVDKKSGTIYVLEPMSNRIRKITVE